MAVPRRVLFVASYPERAACTRFRAAAFFDALRARGIEPTLAPFLDDSFFAGFYRGGGRITKAVGLARAAARRVALLAEAGRFDALFVQREAALVGPAVFEAICARGLRLPLVFDFDDALWITDPSTSPGMASKHPLAARLLKFPSKTAHLVAMATHVVAGSERLGRWAREHTRADRVTVLPTVVSRSTWSPLPGRLDGAHLGAPPVVGWVGTHSTALQLDMVLPALQRLADDGVAFRFRMVGAQRPDVRIAGVEVADEPWRLERDVLDFQELDVGLGPMFDDAWSEGKCGFKQLQYMAVGVPHVTSLSGGARDFVVDGENALVARTPDDWYRHVRALLEDRPLRARLARAGRALVERSLCSEVIGERLADIVERAANERPRAAVGAPLG